MWQVRFASIIGYRYYHTRAGHKLSSRANSSLKKAGPFNPLSRAYAPSASSILAALTTAPCCCSFFPYCLSTVFVVFALAYTADVERGTSSAVVVAFLWRFSSPLLHTEDIQGFKYVLPHHDKLLLNITNRYTKALFSVEPLAQNFFLSTLSHSQNYLQFAKLFIL